MILEPRQPTVAPADLARFLVAFGLVPLLLVRDSPPWSFALTPTWSTEQLVFIALAGGVLGVTSGRPAQGLAGVTLGILLGLAFDLWWLAGWVTSYDQTFVTMLPQAEWHSDVTRSALALLGGISVGFMVGAAVKRLIRDPSATRLRRPTRSEAVAVGLAVIIAPLLAVTIASAAASSALLVPDGAQVQTVWVSAGTITVEPVTLRPGPTRFRCHFAPDAPSEWARLLARPPGVDVEVASPSFEDLSACGFEPGSVTWGTVTDLQPGRYVWTQIDMRTEVLQTIATSSVFVVAP